MWQYKLRINRFVRQLPAKDYLICKGWKEILLLQQKKDGNN